MTFIRGEFPMDETRKITFVGKKLITTTQEWVFTCSICGDKASPCEHWNRAFALEDSGTAPTPPDLLAMLEEILDSAEYQRGTTYELNARPIEKAQDMVTKYKSFAEAAKANTQGFCSVCGWIKTLCKCGAVGAVPEKARQEEVMDESGWLIEKGQLCLGSCDRKPAWVTFTDPSAVRFARKIDAENMLNSLRSMGKDGAFEKCTISEHMWIDGAAPAVESAPQCPACGTSTDRKDGQHWVALDGGKRVCTNPWHNPKGFDRRAVESAATPDPVFVKGKCPTCGHDLNTDPPATAKEHK